MKILSRYRMFKRFYHPGRPIYEQPHFKSNLKKVAIHDNVGDHTYGDLQVGSDKIASALSKNLTAGKNANVAFLTPNNHHYTLAQLGIWKSGLSCVPLCQSHPPETLKYYIEDSQASALIVTKDFVDKIGDLKKYSKLLILEDLLEESSSKVEGIKGVEGEDNALLIYTSGTTGSPKGVVLTMNNVIAQTECMIKPWAWQESDKILHILPLHHTHGIINCHLCPLHIGASIRMLPRFEAKTVWHQLLKGDVNVFMAVPTVYAKLLEYLKNNDEFADNVEDTLKAKIRLMVSGSAALPQPIFEEWQNKTGHILLERYGMTEIGMALTNPYVGQRKPGFVGHPFPGVQARIVGPEGKILVQGDEFSTNISARSDEEVNGDLQIKGSNVFKCYYGRPEATTKEFTDDGWFKTGDTAQFSEQSYKILGRSSVDIIK